MNKFDKDIKKIVDEEKKEIPENIYSFVDDILENLPEKTFEMKKEKNNRWIYKAAAALIVVFLLVPNISSKAAYAMENIPVIGNVVSVITIKNYFYKDGNAELHVKLPWIDDPSEGSNMINQDIDEMKEKIIDEFKKDLNENDENMYMYQCVDYKTITDSDKWFTLKITFSKTMASSEINITYYNLDKMTGKIVSFNELFKAGSEYKKAIKDEIIRQMEDEMSKDSSKTYWTEAENPDWDYLDIGENTNYYIDEKGRLVVEFDQGQVAPYSMGNPSFIIDKDVISDYLNQQFFEYIE